MKRIIKSNISTYEVGDEVLYDSNWRGVHPRTGTATIVAIHPGLAGHGDPRPSAVYTLEKPDGTRFKLDGPGIIDYADSSM